MNQVQATHKQISNPQKQEEIVVQATPRVPGEYENAATDDDAEYLCQTVEKDVAVKTGEEQSE
jgi:hypothetical protein